jgi:uncharacterized protein YbjT (DUF2867 family)
MPDKKIITIFGATGAQGGGLAHAILDDPQSAFSVRAATRDPESDKAKELAQKGAEIVKADLDDVESIKKALEGAYGAYFVTFFWAHFSPEKEIAEARNMALAAKETGLKHAIWSTLEDVREYVPLSDDSMPTLGGKYKVPHFDGKGESNHFFTDAGVPTTFLYTSFYWDNMIYFGMNPKRGEDGKLTLTIPLANKKLSGIAAEDIGRSAYGIFKKGEEFIGKSVGISGGHLTGEEMVNALSKSLAEEVKYQSIPFDVFRGLGFPGADDLGNMFQFYHDFENEFNSKRSVEFTKQLNPSLKSFDTWLDENVKLIPLN